MPDKKKDGGSTAVMTTNPDHIKKDSGGKKPPVKRRLTTEEIESGFAYDPMHFIRSHSKNNDPADVSTQIWEVVFEPDPNNPSQTTTKVATCGGNSICIIDVNTGTVLMKYKHKELKENFYSLAWSTLALGDNQKTNILVSGGIRGEIRMFHPDHKVCYHEWRPVEKKAIAINTLVFHSEKPTWLFCGTGDGYVSLWDIGTPSMPSYDNVNPVQLLRLNPDYGDVYNIAWTGPNRWLLAGTAAGLVGWNIDDDKVMNNENEYKPVMYEFVQPESPNDKGENPIVDSLAVTSDWTVASKCATHGYIYVWDLKATVKSAEKSKSEEGSNNVAVVEQDVELIANLRWSDTDNYFMNLGCHKGKGLIVCGDDKGSLWLYNQPTFGNPPEKGLTALKDVVEPTAKLIWPELQDDHLENSRKLPLDRHDIIIDKVASSHDNNHIVAVTNNNMVCIWKKVSDEDSSSTTASDN